LAGTVPRQVYASHGVFRKLREQATQNACAYPVGGTRASATLVLQDALAVELHAAAKSEVDQLAEYLSNLVMTKVLSRVFAMCLPASLLAAPPTTETTLRLKVTSVHDGDTLIGINESNEQVKVRLDAIDAPELSQPYGQASRKALAEKVFGKVVTVTTKKRDQYGRVIGHVIVGKRDVNLELLEEGAVWHYEQYDKNKRLRESRAVSPSRQEGALAGAQSSGPVGLAEDRAGAEGEVGAWSGSAAGCRRSGNASPQGRA
jgi:micrococcal nuclease